MTGFIRYHVLFFLLIIHAPLAWTMESSVTASATVTVDLFANPGNTPVNNYRAILTAPNSNPDTAYSVGNRVTFVNVPTDVDENNFTLPDKLKLEQNYPNPFNPSTNIEFLLNEETPVRLEIFDIQGRLVKTIVDDKLSAGKYKATWAADNNNGDQVASGVYIYRLISGDKSQSKKMINLGGGAGVSGLAYVGGAPPLEKLVEGKGLGKLNDVPHELRLESLEGTAPGFRDTTLYFFVPGNINMNVTASKARNIFGTLTDFQNNPQEGYLIAVNAFGDTAVAQANVLGKYKLQIRPSDGDTVHGHIANPGRNQAFIRTLYLPGNGTATGIVVDAVPSLADSAYIPLDVMGSAAWEGNFQPGSGMVYEGLKKADLDSLREVISSIYTITGDTINASEQLGLKRIIEQEIDPYFVHASQKYLVPQDSAMSGVIMNAINWFKHRQQPVPGSIASADFNQDGIIDVSEIRLSYIRQIIGQDTLYNSIIVQEGLSGRVAPFEVGFTSTISPNATVLHRQTNVSRMQPFDKWLVKLAEHYAPRTSYFTILNVGNLQPVVESKTAHS